MTAQKTNTPGTKPAYKVGDVLPDGWIFLGTSPKTGKPYSLEPFNSAVRTLTTWDQGQRHAAALRRKGIVGARQPYEANSNVNALSGNELMDIFRKIVKGGHNDKARLVDRGPIPDSRYWSSTEEQGRNYVHAESRCFTNGRRQAYYKDGGAHVRCVRDEPQLSI